MDQAAPRSDPTRAPTVEPNTQSTPSTQATARPRNPKVARTRERLRAAGFTVDDETEPPGYLGELKLRFGADLKVSVYVAPTKTAAQQLKAELADLERKNPNHVHLKVVTTSVVAGFFDARDSSAATQFEAVLGALR
jgi:hypothetical protein